ncbi:MAG: hypothetical protein B6I20_10830 [Bacteroidetes bacterium 4572_117]|nr:MAG: hypothetical protein B6I20_10830 [Bacteroidetes bacterium 4572_117]
MTAKTKKRMGFGLSGMLILATIISTIALIGMKKPAEHKTEVDNRITVSTLEVKNTEIRSKINVIGKTTGKQKIEIFSEVSGVLENTPKDFLEGVSYNKNEVLLRINNDENYMSLVSQRSSLLNLITKIIPDLKFDYPKSYENWKNYLENFEIEKTTQNLPKAENNQEKYYIAGQGIYQTYYNIKSLETRQAKFTIRAPFNGVVSQSTIKPGTLVRSGQKIGEFFNPNIYDLEVEINRAEIDFIKINDKVELTDATTQKSWTGTVTRISDIIDSKTQTVKIFITVSGNDLREGLYLSGNIKTSVKNNAFQLPRKLIVNNNEVFVVENNKIISKKVNIVQTSEEYCIITGLEDGTLISEKTKGIHNDMSVKY